MEESAKLTPVVKKNEKLQSSEVRQKPPVDEGEIEDEVADSNFEEDAIEDFYGDDTFKDAAAAAKVKSAGEFVPDDSDQDDDGKNLDVDELDLDYSQTHLDDFLKSHTSSSMLKGTNI